MIYLDNAATTKVHDEVIEAMLPYFSETYGNPSSNHQCGAAAKQAVENARESLLNILHAKNGTIIFTSGATESNEIAALRLIENVLFVIGFGDSHDSIERFTNFESLTNLISPSTTSQGTIAVNECTMSLEGVIKILNNTSTSAALLSINHVNHELGGVNNIVKLGDEISKLRERKNVDLYYHVDATQSFGFYDLNVDKIGCDLLTFAGHKIHGPKGIGALYIKEGITDIDKSKLQEFGLRFGTENVPGIVGLAKAAEIAHRNINEMQKRIYNLKELFYNTLKYNMTQNGTIDRLVLNGRFNECPKILSLRFNGISNQTLLMMMNMHGVCAAAGSACQSNSQKPNRILISSGLTPEQAENTVRFSFSQYNNDDEMKSAANVVAACVHTIVNDLENGEENGEEED